MTNSSPLSLFGLSTRAANILKRYDISTVDDLVSIVEEYGGIEVFLMIRGIGEDTYKRIEAIYDAHMAGNLEALKTDIASDIQSESDTANNLCGECGYFALAPFKKWSGACLGSYDQKTATYHATSYHHAEKDCWWCPGWLDPTALEKPKAELKTIKSGPLFDTLQFTCCGYKFSEPKTVAGYTDLEKNFCPKCNEPIEQ